jgi:hypothetical protein
MTPYPIAEELARTRKFGPDCGDVSGNMAAALKPWVAAELDDYDDYLSNDTEDDRRALLTVIAELVALAMLAQHRAHQDLMSEEVAP